MPDTDIFAGGGETTPTPAAQVTPAPVVPQDLLNSIVGENGAPKYASVEEALKALKHAQEYIPQVKAQLTEKDRLLAEAQAKLAATESVQETIARLTASQNQVAPASPQASTSGLDEGAVAAIVKQQLEQANTAANAAANRKQVNAALISTYGDKAVEVLKAKATELGTTVEQLGDLSSKSPHLVLALFNESGSNPQFKSTTTSVNIPPTNTQAPAMPKPEKSLLSGATFKDQAHYLNQIRAVVHNKLGVTQ